MVRRTRIATWFVLVALLLVPLTGCHNSDSPDVGEAEQAVEDDEAVEAGEAVAGSFVGSVSGTRAFVAVVAAPAASEKGTRDVEVYVADGRRLSEWFSGSIANNAFAARSDEGDTEARGKLSGDSVTGTVELPGGKSVRFEAGPPSGPAGLYDLTVSSGGDLSGSSTAGLGVTGEIPLRERGTGMLRLVDGQRLTFAISRNAPSDLIRLQAGQVRLIVLPGGEVRGAGEGRSSADGGDSSFFIRSPG